MNTKPTYNEIANSYQLWQEYADPSGFDSKAAFEAKSVEAKIDFLKSCFGEETEN